MEPGPRWVRVHQVKPGGTKRRRHQDEGLGRLWGVVKSGTGGEAEARARGLEAPGPEQRAGRKPGQGRSRGQDRGLGRGRTRLGRPRRLAALVPRPGLRPSPRSGLYLGGRLRCRQSWRCVLPCSTWTGSWRCPRSPAPGTVRRRSWRCPGKGTRAAARTQKPARVCPGGRSATPVRSCLSGLPALVSDCCRARALGERLKQLLDPKVPVCVTRSIWRSSCLMRRR